MPRWLPLATMPALAGLAIGCGDSNHPVAPIGIHFNNVSLAANPNNVLSAVTKFAVTGADSVHVVYWSDSADAKATPFTAAAASDSVVVLGLAPETQYQMAVEAVKGGTPVRSDTLAFTTAALPTLLANARLESSTPFSGGYILAALVDSSGAYGVAFDSTGQVRWYRGFNEGVPAGEFKQQPNGDFTIFLGATHGGQTVPGRYVEVTPGGDVVREFSAPAGAFTDNHELRLLFKDGQYDGAVMFTYTERHVDLSAQGGPSDTAVTGHQVVRVAADGSMRTVFDAWDHFTLADNVEPIGGEADFDHPNAVDIAPDGNYIVSWRNFDLITKIGADSGNIIWRLGGPHSDFTITGDPLGRFSAQHSARAIGNDHVLIFDNGTQHSPPESRAVEYALDTGAKTATMVFQYRHSPPVYTQFTGSVQRLQNGNTFVGFTWAPNLIATEVAPDGSVVWEGTLGSGSLPSPYRFTKVVSLYQYEQP
ncbi:MAG TPA: aryl-sulfate sulfotransferase [Gemmatimonadaceae bacterium]|nr:aryl-sulfate sulfotransferase [Gemmatimonadaceae bacterium]